MGANQSFIIIIIITIIIQFNITIIKRLACMFVAAL